jgi:hypothetical protein
VPGGGGLIWLIRHHPASWSRDQDKDSPGAQAKMSRWLDVIHTGLAYNKGERSIVTSYEVPGACHVSS